MKRGIRRAKTKAIVKKRVRIAKVANLLGISGKKEEQPHRVAKHKVKFTHDRSSLKEDKQIANRASRHRAKQAIRAEKEIPPESPNSVKYDYW